MLSVKDFGATGDGASDDTAAIQAAIDACLPFNTVLFPVGTYVISGQLTVTTNNIQLTGPARLLAKAGVSFELMLLVSSCTGVSVEFLDFDVNQSARAGVQAVLYSGAKFASCTDSRFLNCSVRHTRGYSTNSAVGLVVSAGTRCRVDSCSLIDCGTSTLTSDGIFTSGTQNLINNCIASSCTDTAFVIETSDLSVISGCTSDGCASGGAITNAAVDHHYGNVVSGLTIRNWKASSTGGLQVGCFGAGNLYDTMVDVAMFADTGGGFGSGPAIYVRKTSSGAVTGAVIRGVIKGAGTQGVLVEGDGVTFSGRIEGTTDSCIQFQSGANHQVVAAFLLGGSYGVGANGSASVVVQSTVCKSQTQYGMGASSTATVASLMNVIDSPASGDYLFPAGTTLKLSGRWSGSGAIVSNSASDGVGYAVGAGGAVSQATGKSTGVTLNAVSGGITMNGANLAANASVAFTLTNSCIAATDVVHASIKSGATAGAYLVTTGATASGSCSITLYNCSGGALAESVVLSFAVIKAVAS